MINLKIDDAARVLVVEMKGMISESDIDGRSTPCRPATLLSACICGAASAAASACLWTGKIWKGGKRVRRRSAR